MKIDDKYKWLARDKGGTLWAYDYKPFKDFNRWAEFNGVAIEIKETDSTCSFIKWEDEEPYEIPRNKKAIQTVKEYIDSKVEQTKRLDIINKPDHYHSKGTDVIGFAEAQFSKEEQKGFHRINAIKYITRYDKKGTPLEDLNKAKFYIDKLIELEKPESIPSKPTNDPLQDFLTALRNTKVVTDNSDEKIATFYHGYNPLD